MAKTQTPPAKTNSSRTEQRQTYTLEYATAICPHEGLANNLSTTFGLNPVDAAGIRETTEEHIVRASNELVDNLNDKAMQMHLQRVVGAFVSSACGAGQFYGQKVSQAIDLTSRLANDDRAARGRLFAAETGLQAYALLAAAEGAVSAYAHITGETWKPYEAPRMNSQSVSRQSAAAEMAAFGR